MHLKNATPTIVPCVFQGVFSGRVGVFFGERRLRRRKASGGASGGGLPKRLIVSSPWQIVSSRSHTGNEPVQGKDNTQAFHTLLESQCRKSLLQSPGKPVRWGGSANKSESEQRKQMGANRSRRCVRILGQPLAAKHAVICIVGPHGWFR